jgi:hypothetical protein
MESQITICLTSCARWDLLEKTIKSLVQFWDGPKPEKLLIYEDQDLTDQYKTILHNLVTNCLNCEWEFEIYFGKVGQIAAVTILYSKVTTPYIFHCEDDWEFFKTGFVQKSLSILEEKAHIMQVWIRQSNDRNGHPAIGIVQKTNDGTRYQMMKTGFRGLWHGFSFNCGLRRLSDYQKLYPNGMYADVHWSPSNPLQAEQLVGKQYFKHGFRAATLLEGFVTHSGINRHVNG